MRLIASTLALLAAAAITPLSAHADTFTITPTASGTAPKLTLSFNAPHTPTLFSTVPAGTFSIQTPVTRNGVVDPSDIITFYISANGGGLSDNDSAFEPFGPQLFTGSPLSPTFIYNTFNLSNEAVGGPTDYILTITPTVSTTPEPSSLFLLGTGALSLAGVARRRFQN